MGVDSNASIPNSARNYTMMTVTVVLCEVILLAIASRNKQKRAMATAASKHERRSGPSVALLQASPLLLFPPRYILGPLATHKWVH